MVANGDTSNPRIGATKPLKYAPLNVPRFYVRSKFRSGGFSYFNG
jgi:hypothetical protein